MSSIPTSEIRNRLLLGQAAVQLALLDRASVDCVVTSPPFYRLRDYRMAGQIGHEPSIHGWVDNLLDVFAGIERVLKPTGSVWLNVADTYSRHRRQGARRKSLLLGPERLALALARRGWVVRNKIVWAKSNPMPHSVTDRFTGTWEQIYLLSRSEIGYWFDLDAVRVPHTSSRKPGKATVWTGSYGGTNDGLTALRREGRTGHPLGKNPGDVWRLAKAAHRGDHSATFPERLIETPIRAGCPSVVCAACGQPFQPDGEATCGCRAGTRPGLVLDPFIGTGTTARVAARLGRDWLGIDLTDAHFRPPTEPAEGVAEPLSIPPLPERAFHETVDTCKRGPRHDRAQTRPRHDDSHRPPGQGTHGLPGGSSHSSRAPRHHPAHRERRDRPTAPGDTAEDRPRARS